MFLSKGHRDLRFAFQTHPGSQASCRREAKDSALLSSCALLANAWSPHVIIPLNFQMSVHLKRGYPLRPFIFLGFEDLLDKVSKVGQLPLF